MMKVGVFIGLCYLRIACFFSALVAVIAMSTASSCGFAQTLEGEIAAELSYFWQEGSRVDLPSTVGSVAGELSFSHSWNRGRDYGVFVPFGRLDSDDNKRSHGDIRELLWSHFFDENEWGGRLEGLEFHGGVGREFWGVTEFYHLVDTINQVDFVESLNSEERLGQPLLSLAYQAASHRFEIWWLPVFREREFSDEESRFRFSALLDSEQAIFRSTEKREHQDMAARWSFSVGGGFIGSADIGLSYFKGTAREPYFIVQSSEAAVFLAPFYEQIERFGFDMQWAIGDWLWKIEGLRQNEKQGDFWASTGGFEYSFVGVFGGRTDIGLVLEYMRDQRDERAPHFFQDDIGLGLRVALNDEKGSEVLFSYIEDQEYESRLWRIEGERRINDRWSSAIEVYVFSGIHPADVVFELRQDDHVKFTVTRYF